MNMLKKNMRIQIFDKEGMISDRLVSQTTETYSGPKEKADIYKIEFTIEEKLDVENAINYLRQLSGDLPIKTVKGTQGRKSNELDNDSTFTADKSQFLNDMISENKENQDSLIKSLRDVGFFFVENSQLISIIPEGYKIQKNHLDNNKYQWLIKRTKTAKDPKNDKYDPQILVGVSIINGRNDKVVTYLYGEFNDKFTIPVPDKKAIKLSKTNLINFPHYMVEEERLKWGTEHRILFNTPDKKPSKFYLRWYKDVTVGDELVIKDLNDRI